MLIAQVVACLAFAVVATLVVIVNCDIADSVRTLIRGRDKTLHFFLIGGLAVPASVLCGWRHSTIRLHCVGWGVALMMGLSTAEEFSQIFLPTRTFDWGDLACNYLGIAFFGSVMAIAIGCVRSGGTRTFVRSKQKAPNKVTNH